MPLRNGKRIEGVGLDVAEHGEEAYTAGDGAILVQPRAAALAATGLDVVPMQEGGRL
jgi:hypothetical protein